VEQALDVAHRAAHGTAVQHIAFDLLDVEVREVPHARARPRGHAHGVAPLDELAHDVRPHKPRGSSHQRDPHGAECRSRFEDRLARHA
jgi:hypothetical protein